MNKWELAHGSPSETTIDVESIRQGACAYQLGNDAKKPTVKLALHLLSEQTRLQDVAIGFVDSVARVLKIKTLQ